jgi:hypothetical protein
MTNAATRENTPLVSLPPDTTYAPKTEFRFTPQRFPCNPKAQEVIQTAIAQLERYEMFKELRKRRRRDTDKVPDKSNFDATVTAVISDLCYHYCLAPERKVYISRSKQQIGRKSRYTPTFIGKPLPKILDRLASPELALIGMEIGHHLKGKQTTIWPGPRLVNLIESAKLEASDFDESGTSQLIWLRETHPRDESHWRKGKFLEYDDTQETNRYRQEMGRINAYLAASDITYSTSHGLPQKGPVNARDRSLRRIFNNGSFSQGGRLYGGFWQEWLKKEERQGIRIGGEEAVCLDYSQVCPRILYGNAGATPALDDLYTVTGLKDYREGVKKVMVSLLFRKGDLLRAPRDTRHLLPKKMKIAEVVRLIKMAHPALAPHFGTGVGMGLMFQESQILVEVLLTLADLGVVALPVHDAVVVKKSDEVTTRRVMEEVFRKHTGLDIEVKAE